MGPVERIHLMKRHRNVKIVATLGPASSTYEVIRALVEAGADVPTGNHYGRSALHNAAKREDPAVTKFLIAHGARLNQVCEYGTPLDLTVNRGIAEVLRAAGGSESATKSIASRTHQSYLTKLPSTE